MGNSEENANARILVVDDNFSTLKYIETILTHAGYGVTCIWDCRDTIKMLEEEKFDIILMDYVMPGMDGVTCSKLVHEKFPEVAILIVSARPINQNFEIPMGAGIAGFIEKPFKADELLVKIEEVLLRNEKI